MKPVLKISKPVEIPAAPMIEEDQPVEKKKKRKLGGMGAKTAFDWNQIEVRCSGFQSPTPTDYRNPEANQTDVPALQHPEGPIPSYLSPVKKSTGTLPRAGWGPTSKSFVPRL